MEVIQTFSQKINDDLRLRLIEPADAQEMFALIDQSRNTLRDWLPWVDGTRTVENSEAFIFESLKAYKHKESLTAAIIYRRKLAGISGFNRFDWRNQKAEIDYWLGTDYQGKGIMLRSVSRLIDQAFAVYKLNRVEIRAASDNIRSRRIAEKLGFTHEGCVRQAEWLYDHYVNHELYGILSKEWSLTADDSKK